MAKHGEDVQVHNAGNKNYVKKYFSNPIISLFTVRSKLGIQNGNDDPHVDLNFKKGKLFSASTNTTNNSNNNNEN